jgi:hypothetical protein
MRVFVAHRRNDKEKADQLIEKLLRDSHHSIAIIREEKHSDDWKKQVKVKIREADFVLVILGRDTFDSDPIKWEYETGKSLNKRIVGLTAASVSPETILFCEGFQVFHSTEECSDFLSQTFREDRQLLIEQYRIMVSSTEKVTDQRLTINNLFFTVTSSVVSVALIIAKTFEFSTVGLVGMVLFLILGLVLTFFWEKLVRSYGQLNTGKFRMIDEIEKQLRTNLFEREWHILKDNIHYKPNTETESTIVVWYRYFIILLMIGALFFSAVKASAADTYLWNYATPKSPLPIVDPTIQPTPIE